MDDQKKTVAIVIVTYNGMKWIDLCLSSCGDYPIVVIDNASTDETVSFIKRQYPHVTLFESSENLGFGQANNKGISHALQQGFQHVFLLNQDAYLEPDCLEKLATISAKHPAYGILSPVHLDGSGELLDKRFANHIDFTKNSRFISDVVIGNKLKELYAIPFVNAAGWWVTKECLLTVGGFDPLFFHYGEDDNYCQRVHYHEFKIGVVPGCFMRHDREERLQENPKNRDANAMVTIERRLKKRYANILKENKKELLELRQKRLKESVRSFLKLDWDAFKLKREEARLIKKLLPAIEKSKTQNKQKNHYYLDL